MGESGDNNDMPRPEDIAVAFMLSALRGHATTAEREQILKGISMTIEERETGTPSPLTLRAHHFTLGILYHSTWLEKTKSGASNVVKRIRDILELQPGESTIETVYRLKHANDVAKSRTEEGQKDGKG